MKRWAVVVALVVLMLAGAGFTFLRLFVGSTADLVEVGDQLAVPESWRLVDEKIVGDAAVCPEGGCPSLSRSYSVDQALSADDLDGVVRASGWSLSVTGDCQPLPNRFGSFTVCQASGVVSGQRVELRQERSEDPDAPALIGLRVLPIER